jgi:hypothetical protein
MAYYDHWDIDESRTQERTVFFHCASVLVWSLRRRVHLTRVVVSLRGNKRRPNSWRELSSKIR